MVWALAPGVLEACGPCLSQRGNVVVSGITGAGKTTLLQALARLLPSNEPVLVLDDCAELDLDGPLREFVPLRRGNPAESPREAVARALRDSPRRLVFANVCPPETALRQLATWSLADGFSWGAAYAAIPTAIDVVVRLDREASGRRRLRTPTGLSWQPRPSGCVMRR